MRFGEVVEAEVETRCSVEEVRRVGVFFPFFVGEMSVVVEFLAENHYKTNHEPSKKTLKILEN